MNARIEKVEEALMSARSQTFASHTRFDPPFHFFALPVFAITLIWTVVNLVRSPSLWSGWMVVFMLAALVALFKIRLNALRVQDRVIRLEERLRLSALVDEGWRPNIPLLTISQLIGLRFASDAELPGLADRALREKMSRADIKKAIKNWRTDDWRV
jgi:Family of unknown function (DUF6526)